jgi:carbonic anhydrase
MNAEQALQTLMSGNAAYREGKHSAKDTSSQRRKDLSKGQAPCAVVVSCADSRVVPEYIFDMGLGQLFVVRVAGNVLGEAELASIEYATHHLGVELIMILGHNSCGAIAAAIKGETQGLVGYLTLPIRKIIADETDPKRAAVLNVKGQVAVCRAHFDMPQVHTVGAIYDIVSGAVTLYE